MKRQEAVFLNFNGAQESIPPVYPIPVRFLAPIDSYKIPAQRRRGASAYGGFCNSCITKRM
jgi:hypothetical protein